MRLDDSTLHAALIATFLERQRPPTVHELAERFDCGEEEARKALRGLADLHGVVLHPHSDEVWVAHPFSAAPTTCVVSSGDRKWWGNCAWCSLGVAQLAGGSATIETRVGAVDAPVTIRIERGVVDVHLRGHAGLSRRGTSGRLVPPAGHTEGRRPTDWTSLAVRRRVVRQARGCRLGEVVDAPGGGDVLAPWPDRPGVDSANGRVSILSAPGGEEGQPGT